MGKISSILSLLDKEHGIIVDNNIGLIGNAECEINYPVEQLYDARNTNHQYIVGEYFQVICDKGYILFEEYITHTYSIISNGEPSEYIFRLKDYSVEDALNDFFGFEKQKYAVIYFNCKTGEISTNCKELSSKYTYDDTIELTDKSVKIGENTYRFLLIDFINRIYELEKKEEN